LCVVLDDDGDAAVRLDVPHTPEHVPVVLTFWLAVEREVQTVAQGHEHDRHVVRPRVLVRRRQMGDASRAEHRARRRVELGHRRRGRMSRAYRRIARSWSWPGKWKTRWVKPHATYSRIFPTCSSGSVDTMKRVCALASPALARFSISRGSSTPALSSAGSASADHSFVSVIARSRSLS